MKLNSEQEEILGSYVNSLNSHFMGKDILMTSTEHSRMLALGDPWCSSDLIMDLFGVEYTDDTDNALWRTCRFWVESVRKKILVNKEGQINRHEFEGYLLDNKLTSSIRAAFSLGMTEDSLIKTITALEKKALLTSSSFRQYNVVSSTDVRRLHEFFPSLRSKIFASHTSYC